jgi:putative transposase
VYLGALRDGYRRSVVAWELSNTLASAFCVTALERALARARPLRFNPDQGSQFTSLEFTGRLLAADGRISLDGRGRALDNGFVERRWRTVKYEEGSLKGEETIAVAGGSLSDYFRFYPEQRLHQALAYRTPAAVYLEQAATRAQPGCCPAPGLPASAHPNFYRAPGCLDHGDHLIAQRALGSLIASI